MAKTATLRATEQAFEHARVSDLHSEPFQIRIHSMTGNLQRHKQQRAGADPLAMEHMAGGIGDYYVEAYVYGGNRALCNPVSTSYRAFSEAWCWEEWLRFPLALADLPRDAKLVVNVLEPNGPGEAQVVGGTALELFTTGGLVRRGYVTVKLEQQSERVPPSQVDPTLAPPTDAGRIHGHLASYWEHQVPHVPWLDSLTARHLQDDLKAAVHKDTNQLYLKLQLPCYHTEILYAEKGGVLAKHCVIALRTGLDPELRMDHNLVEAMYHQQLDSNDQLAADKHDKPNPAARDKLRDLLRRPPGTDLQSDEYNLLWRFRYYLTRDKKAVTKVMKSVNWKKEEEVARAEEVLPLWDEIDIDDALELLGKGFWHHVPRQYAVHRLMKAETSELAMYSLQLVQAIKYEPHFANDSPAATTSKGERTKTPVIGSRPGSPTAASQPGSPDKTKTRSKPDPNMRLDTFLIDRCSKSLSLATAVYWYLRVEGMDDKSRHLKTYQGVFARLNRMLANNTNKRVSLRIIQAGELLLRNLQELSQALVDKKLDRIKRMEYLRQVLATDPKFTNMPAVPLPLDPSVIVTGIRADNALIFKSAMMPLGITFTTKTGGEYAIVLKTGDDLRQDQLVLQVIRLMDQLLKKENLDLHLTPYECLATSADSGLVELVRGSEALAKISNIQKYLLEHNPDPNNAGSVHPQVMDNYVRSCAGYCVVTYLLGVGDRHLDNLLLKSDGHLFHIDFGYFLGRDPKPYPPPMKLTKDMMEAMGGTNGEAAQRFRSHCYNCFLILRKHANLILNLFALMLDSNVQDIAFNREKAVSKVHDKFKLELDDEQAVKYFQDLLETSIQALFPRLVEAAHTFAQMMRK